MQKVAFIIIACFLTTGCASIRKAERYEGVSVGDTAGIGFTESVKLQNLTLKSFFIQKAEIEYISGEKKQKFLATIKFEYPDRYLISLKSKTGLEGARIFISHDSVLVNDRINKIEYFGNSLYLRRKFGIDQSFLPVLFGDFIENEYKFITKDKCVNGRSDLLRIVHGVKLHYLIDCAKRKVTGVDIANSYGNTVIESRFQEFKELGSLFVPKMVKINYIDSSLKVNIKILKIEYPWNGNVKFFPGKGYELIELL